MTTPDNHSMSINENTLFSIPAKPPAPVSEAKLSLTVHTRTAEEQAMLNRHSAARALPDSMFTDHPEVVQARQVAQHAQRRVEAAPVLAGMVDQVADHITAANEAIAELERALDRAVIDDLLAADTDFGRATAVQNMLHDLENRRVLLKRAYDLARHTSFSDQIKLKGAAQEAASALSNLVFKLKCQHVDRHPHPMAGGQPV